MLKIDGQEVELSKSVEVKAGTKVCINIASGGHWYGHGFNHDQPYPLETGEINNTAFAVNNIQSPIWMCSAGYAFLTDTNSELNVQFNANEDGKLQISCVDDFCLKIFSGNNLIEAWQLMRNELGWTRPTPPAELVEDSLFCTWTQYPRAITQSRILEMASDIRMHDYPCSTIIIDDRWENCFGELAFGPDFPDPKAMIEELHSMNFKVILWVTPFVNDNCAVYEKLASIGALVKNINSDGAADFRWWGGTAGLVDLTTKAGQNWYQGRILYLKDEIGVDGFKIDGGDAKYMPADENCVWGEHPGRSGYSDILLKTFEEVAAGMCETRTAWLSQNRNIIWRLGGKDSHWGLDNGLKALVTLSLHLSLMGYDMMIPDMVPGRVQTMDASMTLPTDELMVRWTEISSFFPLLQFSYFPWNYDKTTADAVHGFAKVHKALEDYILNAAKDTSAPLIKPIWFLNPDNEELYEIYDQFLLGSDLMVCPVLDEGVVERSLLIPEGDWIDAWTGNSIASGRQTVQSLCPGMPIYVRASNSELLEKIHTILADIERGIIKSGIITATHQCGLNRDLSVSG